MTAAIIHVGDKVTIKARKTYAYPALAEHVGKHGKVTKVLDDGDYVIKVEPDRTGMTLTGVVRGRNSQGLRLSVGRLDVEKVKD